MGKKKATSGIVLILLFLFILSNVSADLSITVSMKGGCGSTFSVGDEISFTITLSESAYVTVNVITPDDEKEIVKNLYRSKGEHDFTYTVIGPEGRHSLVAKVRDKYGKIIEDTCEFKVIDRKDSDNDGVPDSRDQCANSSCNSVDATGCPKDSDGDGVNDCKDQCANSPCDSVDVTGCPLDSDNDGVNDCEDQCPEEEGVPSQNGCPVIPPETPNSPSPHTSSLFQSGFPSSILYLAILIILLFITLLVYRMTKKNKSLIESQKYGKKEYKKLRKKLDEDYIEDKISRKEYLRKKKELGDE